MTSVLCKRRQRVFSDRGCSLGILGDCCLGSIISSCHCGDPAIFDCCILKEFKDVIRETKCFGVQIEVPIRWWIVARITIIPSDVCEREGHLAILRITEEII